MRKKLLLVVGLFIMASVSLFTSCKKDEDPANNPPTLDVSSPATSTLTVDRGEVVAFDFVARYNLNSKSGLENIYIEAKYSVGGSDIVLDYDVPTASNNEVSKTVNYTVPATTAYGTVITVSIKVTDKAGKFAEKLYTLTVTNLSDLNTYTNVELGAQGNNSLGSAYASDLNNVYKSVDAKTNQTRIDFLYFHDDTTPANAHTLAAPNDATLASVTGLVKDWVSKNATTFKVVSGYTSAEFNALTTAAEITQVWQLAGTALTKATNVAQNGYIVFKTSKTKYGIIEVASLTEAAVKKESSMTINVKVQK